MLLCPGDLLCDALRKRNGRAASLICAKENIKCVMNLDTDQRRQINRNNRNTKDKLPDNLVSALRTAPAAYADT
jgi:hypothetical protein